MLDSKGEDRNIAQFELDNAAQTDLVSTGSGWIVCTLGTHCFFAWILNLGSVLMFHVGGNGRP